MTNYNHNTFSEFTARLSTIPTSLGKIGEIAEVDKEEDVTFTVEVEDERARKLLERLTILVSFINGVDRQEAVPVGRSSWLHKQLEECGFFGSGRTMNEITEDVNKKMFNKFATAKPVEADPQNIEYGEQEEFK